MSACEWVPTTECLRRRGSKGDVVDCRVVECVEPPLSRVDRALPPRDSAHVAAKPGFIQCYGLFWDVDEVAWSGREFRLLGRRGRSLGASLRVCDFRNQVGIYVLYDDYGPYYVGLTRRQPLGNRIKQHLGDHHRGLWQRFSWFGFRQVRPLRHADGTQALAPPPKNLTTPTRETIGDVEALLIQALGTHKRGNRIEMRFGLAERWQQIVLKDRKTFLERVEPEAGRRVVPRESRAAFRAAVAGTSMPSIRGA